MKVGGLTPSPCHRVISPDQKLWVFFYPILSLSTQVYTDGYWRHAAGGNPAME